MPNYWFDVFTPSTWNEAATNGFTVTGFSPSRRKFVERVQIDDVFLCYLKGTKTLVGALRATGKSYFATNPSIWSSQFFPVRVPVEPIVILDATKALDLEKMIQHLSFYDATNWRRVWGKFQGSPTSLSASDGELLLAALLAESTSQPELHTEPAMVFQSPALVDSPSIEEIPTSILMRLDPLESMISEIVAAQRDAGKPSRLEQAVAIGLSFLGFDTEWIGKSGTPDVLINSPLGLDKFRAIVDAKATSSGKVAEGQVNWAAINDHRRNASADYAAVIGEKFADGNMIKHAKDYDISLIDTDSFTTILRLHSETPFTAADLRQIFSTPGPVTTTVADLRQKADASRRHWVLIAEIVILVDRFSRTDPPLTPTVGSLHASLVTMALSDLSGQKSPPSEIDVREAVTYLSCRAVGILRPVEPEFGGFRLSMSVPASVQRLVALERIVGGSIRGDGRISIAATVADSSA